MPSRSKERERKLREVKPFTLRVQVLNNFVFVHINAHDRNDALRQARTVKRGICTSLLEGRL
jgi:hypothetical protein